jgi:hypothetical protein
MGQEFYVTRVIKNKDVPSSAVKCGTLKQCEQTAKRMNRNKEKHPTVRYEVKPCQS